MKNETTLKKIDNEIIVVGGGLAGSEAALQLAELGYQVKLYEMRPETKGPAHESGDLAELVCSNSLKSTDPSSAAGLLKLELKLLGSKLLDIAYETQVDAGIALAVDRKLFSKQVEEALNKSPNIEIIRKEFKDINEVSESNIVVLAIGPLPSDGISDELKSLVGEGLSFFDAAAPIVFKDSLDMNRVFPASRYGKGSGDDYLNAAFDRSEYESFYNELISAKKVISKEFESKELFRACQPVEEVARTGFDALRYGALKPVGITDPNSDLRPFAVLQLRAETRDKQSYNLVGFQTNLSWPEQKRVFSLIPGFENARFARYGVMHKNTFIDAPLYINKRQQLKSNPNIFFAGQIAGTEGYTEAIASGLMAAYQVDAYLNGEEPRILPKTGSLGSLLSYAFNEETQDYQPMHVNFGLFPPLEVPVRNKRVRYVAYARRALNDLATVLLASPWKRDEEFIKLELERAFAALDEKENTVLNIKKRRKAKREQREYK